MGELTIYLEETTKAQFSDWLSVYCNYKRNKSYLYDKGRNYSLSFPVSKLDDCNQISIDAIITEWESVRKSNEDEGIFSDNSFTQKGVITITWLEIGKRIKLAINHDRGKMYLSPVLELLSAISSDWQGTVGDILNYVEEQAKSHNVMIDTSQFRADLDKVRPVRPDGYELHADNTQGTAIYKRDESGKIGELQAYPNPGWYPRIADDSFSFGRMPDKVTEGIGFTGSVQDDKYRFSKTFNNPENIQQLRTRFVSMLNSQPSRLDFITCKKVEEELTAFYEIFSQDETHLGTVEFFPIDENNTAITYQYQGKYSEIFDKIRMYFEETDRYHKSLSKDLNATRIEKIKPDRESQKRKKVAKPRKTKTPNLQTQKRAIIWRHLSPWIKSMKVEPTAKECIEEIKKRPGYGDKIITRQRMQKILSEGMSGAYDDILKSV